MGAYKGQPAQFHTPQNHIAHLKEKAPVDKGHTVIPEGIECDRQDSYIYRRDLHNRTLPAHGKIFPGLRMFVGSKTALIFFMSSSSSGPISIEI